MAQTCTYDGCNNPRPMDEKYCRECQAWLGDYSAENAHL